MQDRQNNGDGCVNVMHIAFAIFVFICGVSILILSVGGIIGSFYPFLHDPSPLVIFGFASSWFGLVCSVGIIWLSRKLADYATIRTRASQATQATPASVPVQPSNTVSILVQHPSGHLELGTTTKHEHEPLPMPSSMPNKN